MGVGGTPNNAMRAHRYPEPTRDPKPGSLSRTDGARSPDGQGQIRLVSQSRARTEPKGLMSKKDRH